MSEEKSMEVGGGGVARAEVRVEVRVPEAVKMARREVNRILWVVEVVLEEVVLVVVVER